MKKDDIDIIKVKSGNGYALKITKCQVTRFDIYDVTHSHTVPELSFFLKGSGVYHLDEQKISFKAGDIVFVPIGSRHRISDISEEIEFIDIWFDAEKLKLGEKSFIDDCYSAFSKTGIKRKHLISVNSENHKMLKDMIMHIYREGSEKGVGHFSIIRSLLSALMVLLFREFNIDIPDDSLLLNTKNDGIEKSMEYICDRLGEKFTLEELAKVACMSRKHYCTTFKKINGTTPWEYITGKKIEIAQELLRTTKKSIIEIAFECGFSNSANFNRAFRKYSGMTPSEYRKEK